VAAKQPLGAVNAAEWAVNVEGNGERRGNDGWQQSDRERDNYRPRGIRNVKPERRWADQRGDSEHDLEACTVPEGEEKGFVQEYSKLLSCKCMSVSARAHQCIFRNVFYDAVSIQPIVRRMV
jgi:hypothetical protein